MFEIIISPLRKTKYQWNWIRRTEFAQECALLADSMQIIL
jgi:hypothetical protein